MFSLPKLHLLSMSVALASLLSTSLASAQNATEQKVKIEVQKQLGDRAKVTAVRSTPISGLYEVAIGSDVVYADASARYLIQGEVIDLKTGIN